MGQTNRMSTLKDPPRDWASSEHTQLQLRAIIDPVFNARRNASRLLTRAQNDFAFPESDFDGLSDQERAMFSSPELHQNYFGDTVVSFGQFVTPHALPNLSMIEAVIATASLQLFSYLLLEIPARGVIELGIGQRMPEGDLYGPLLLQLYELERCSVGYPRIVIGPRLANFWNSFRPTAEKEYQAKVSNYVRAIDECIVNDTDGKPVVDFIHHVYDMMRNSDQRESAMASYCTKITEFAKSQATAAASRHNDKHERYYRQLETFVAASMDGCRSE